MPHDTVTDKGAGEGPGEGPGEVVAGLRAWAKGSYPIEAAAELLIRACGGRLITGPWIRPLDHDGWFWIDVERPAKAGALSGADKRVFDLVASLAYPEYPVSLNHALPGLDRDNLELVLAAVAHAAGSHQQSRIITAYSWPGNTDTADPAAETATENGTGTGSGTGMGAE